MAQALESKSYAPGVTIIRAGQIGEEMFIIGHGEVEVILRDGSSAATLRDGQIFGEASLLKKTLRQANVRSKTYSDLYRLAREKFLDIIERHPELRAQIEVTTMRRKDDTTTKKKVA